MSFKNMALSFVDWFLLLVGLLAALYAYGMWQYGHFARKGIPAFVPKVPFLGMGMPALFQLEHVSMLIDRIYNQFPGQRYFGTFEGPTPLIILKDVELIKKVCIKEFDTFNAHRTIISEDADPMYGNFLVILKGQKWHDMRSTLSPAFTSSKMKNMFEFVEECSQQTADYYLKQFTPGKSVVEFEAKDIFSYYTNDVIATAVFGLKINSLEDPNCEFYKMAKKATDFSGVQFLKMMCFAIMPRVMLLFDIPLIRRDIKKYFSQLVLGTMAEREKNGIIRHDMIHLLMEAKKGALKHEEASTKEHAGYATVEESSVGKKKVERKWSDDELVAQTVVFIIGGFDTTSTILTFLMYELAKNPEIQKKLQEEIDEYKRETSDTLTYTDLPKLKYLDMVVSESLRLWPSFGNVDRVANTKFTLPPPNDSSNSYEIQKNHAVWIPIRNIHRDAQYFPNPLKFDPERFSDENKSSIQSGSYLPFGIGPRNCIGSRFALMIVKAIVFSMLSKFDIVVTSKTQIPVQLSKKTFNMITEKGMWLGLKLRTT